LTKVQIRRGKLYILLFLFVKMLPGLEVLNTFTYYPNTVIYFKCYRFAIQMSSPVHHTLTSMLHVAFCPLVSIII